MMDFTFPIEAATSNSGPYEGTVATALASFIHRCAEQGTGPGMSVAMFALSMWQMSCGPWTRTVPSVLLVNAGDALTDPVDAFAEKFAFSIGHLDEDVAGRNAVKSTHLPGNADERMRTALSLSQHLPSDHPLKRTYLDEFHGDRSRLFGYGPAARYSRAWVEEYGWLSGDEDRLVLRLDKPEDRRAFLADVLNHAERLHQPTGVGRELTRVPKSLALSGSLHSAEWDEPLVTKLLTSGRPVLFLPHTQIDPFAVPHAVDMHLARMTVKKRAWRKQVFAEEILEKDRWRDHYHHQLLSRLHHMPTDYAFGMQRMFRELGEVCSRLAQTFCGIYRQPNDPALITILGMDLYRMTMRSMVIGVAALAYHSWGFDAGCPRKDVAAVLHHLRSRASMSLRDLQRRFPALDATKRNAVLRRLAAEGLVEIQGNQVSAVALSAFVDALQQRPEYPATGSLSSLILGKKCPMAGELPESTSPSKRRRRAASAPKDAEAEQGEAANAASETASECNSGCQTPLAASAI